MTEVSIAPLPNIGMDFSKKVTTQSGPDQRDNCSESQADVASATVADHHHHQQLETGGGGNHPCPACPVILSSPHELTNHLRGHNSPRSAAGTTSDGGSGAEDADYVCGVCHKQLSSASSLDRHVLVHSGERPFKCKYCEMAFTTNGNMNRHIRTAHRSLSPSCTDSEEASDDCDRPLKSVVIHDEYNNNEIKRPEKRKRDAEVEEEHNDSRVRRQRLQLSNCGHTTQNLNCDICGKQDFTNKSLLEAHQFAVHRLPSRNSVVGFNDLTYTDFTSAKFPTIARIECEKRLHRPASGELACFQCSKCTRAFPCQSALDDHELTCGQPSDSKPQHSLYDDKSGRQDFFASLDLQNKAALEAKEGKDLADIQSIISMTSRSTLLQNISRAEASTPDNCAVRPMIFGSSGSSSTPSSEYHEEEAQDDFAAEFRKMKLKGEFPCRLCSSVFPNLRALKGHNRNHVNVAQGMPFPCNICTYTAIDKVTLMKHLKSHNGARPYECSLCNYAFTTKANCERHVRNRHGKLSREEIKSVLIYHPSEDSANDTIDACSPARNSLVRDEVRKALVYPNEREDHYPSELRVKDEAQLRQPNVHDIYNNRHHYDKHDTFARPPSTLRQPFDINFRNEHYEQHPENRKSLENEEDSRSSDGSVALIQSETSELHQRKPIDLKRSETGSAEPSTVNANDADDTPLDLSRSVLADASARSAAEATAASSPSDILDLSKKAPTSAKERESIEDLSAKRQEELFNSQQQQQQIMLTQAYLKANHMSQPGLFESLYSNHQLPLANFAAFQNSSLLQPFNLFNQPFFRPTDLHNAIYKDLVRGLGTSGGSLVEGVPNYQSTANAAVPTSATAKIDYASNAVPSASRMMVKPIQPRDRPSTSPSSKLVMKNGMLIPKQKQRRYRTERPFSCEHCAAKFTLRSNMERHVKQQHPQHWSQKPRGAHSTRGRPPANPPTLLPNLRQASTRQRLYQPYPVQTPRVAQNASSESGRHPISDEVKFAILAQQLKANKPEDEADPQLIVEDKTPNHDKTASSKMSLLRGKLESNIESSINEKNEIVDPRNEKINHEVEMLEGKPENREDDEETSDDDEDEEDEDDQKMDCDKDIDPLMVVKTELKADFKKEANESEDLASVSDIVDNASQNYQQFCSQYISEEEGCIGSSDCNQSGSDEKSDSVNSGNSLTAAPVFKKKKMKKKKKKSAYSMAPNRVICPYCQRPFPWTSSLRRHILTHTGQKPYRCPYCTLYFTTKSNCDRHLLRKHKKQAASAEFSRTASVSSPEPQALSPPSNIMPSSEYHSNVSNTSTDLNNSSASNNNNNNNNNVSNSSNNNNNNSLQLRYVPERPYKCNQCPSSTFSTLGNLKKHKSTKHAPNSATNSGSESPSSEPQNSPQECSSLKSPQDCLQVSSPQLEHKSQNNDQSGYESQSSGVSEPLENTSSVQSPNNRINNIANNDSAAKLSKKSSPRSSPGPPTSETPFKCHMCDSGFSERQDCLDHLKNYHEEAYDRLVARGALEKDYDGNDPSDAEETSTRRVRVADYTNRKVICVFCMRRFWSAEDLRRHMRTHTGERPYTCDICGQRFTLKHSMLRHRKKHDSPDSAMYVGTSGDEDSACASAPRSRHQITTSSGLSSVTGSSSRIQQRMSLPQVASVATGDAAPSGLMRPFENGLATLTGKLVAATDSSGADPSENSSDLISNLLGLGDNIIDRALQSSVDDAAKLLGIGKENQE